MMIRKSGGENTFPTRFPHPLPSSACEAFFSASSKAPPRGLRNPVLVASTSNRSLVQSPTDSCQQFFQIKWLVQKAKSTLFVGELSAAVFPVGCEKEDRQFRVLQIEPTLSTTATTRSSEGSPTETPVIKRML